MNNNNLRLDGNAAGGLLNEIFPFEMTLAQATCGDCGTKRPIGELMLYRHEMGAILRCASCDTALIRITKIRGCYRLDLSGMSCLRITADIH
jgi:NAD-dependent SIR2 family protein deacetylase